MLFITFSIVWFAGILIPMLLNENQIDYYYFLKMLYSPVCHQNPEKSFFYNNFQLPVCARCFGIYLGLIIAIIGVQFNLRNKISLRFLSLSLLPMAIDVALYQLKIYTYNKIVSAFTGITFGSILFLFIFESITESVMEKNK